MIHQVNLARFTSKIKSPKRHDYTGKKSKKVKTFANGVQGGSLDDILDQIQWEMEQERQKREREKEKYERGRAERERFERARQQQEYRDQQDRAKKEQHEKKQQTNTSFFSGYKTLSELEAAYRKYAKKLHPDNGGNSEDFARMSNEYEQLKKAM